MAGNTASRVRAADRPTDGITGAAVSGGPIWGEVTVMTASPGQETASEVDLSVSCQRRVWLCPSGKVAPPRQPGAPWRPAIRGGAATQRPPATNRPPRPQPLAIRLGELGWPAPNPSAARPHRPTAPAGSLHTRPETDASSDRRSRSVVLG